MAEIRLARLEICYHLHVSDFVLNKQQKEAVEHGKGPLLIIAGAGTGKTRVITERIIHLIDKKLANSKEILALTFTQKAAQEMEERVDISMPYGYEEIWISTFHSFCDRVLRQEAIYIGIDPSYTLMTQAQEYIFFRSLLFDLPLDRFRPKGNPTKFIGEILKHFSRLGDEDISPEDYIAFVKKENELDDEEKKDYIELSKLYRDYQKEKIKQSKFGFSDLVPLVLKLFRERREVLNRYKKQFKYILVDEFQDTNFAQNELIKILSGKNGNITVVGDDDQAIYKFRGAAISNILDFKKYYPKAKKVVLNQNYRSNQKILDISHKLIENNNPYRLEVTEKVDKKLVSANPKFSNFNNIIDDIHESQIGMPFAPDTNPVRRIHAINEIQEAEEIALEIENIVKDSPDKYKYSDIAILVRANNHSDQIVQTLRYHEIPFTFPGPKGLYNRPEIKDMIAFLKVVADYNDDISMYRILTSPFSVIKTREFVDVQQLARKKRISLFQLMEMLCGKDSDKKGDLYDEDQYYNNVDYRSVSNRILSKKSQKWIANILEIFHKSFEYVRQRKTAGEILYLFAMDGGYIDNLVSNESVQNEWKITNISKFFSILKRFEKETDDPNLYQFLDYLDYSLEIGENPSTESWDIEDINAVNILTIHGAKGLEFPIVFIANLVSDRFPSRDRKDTLPIPEKLIKETLPKGNENIQEERRLFYVGLTRAEDVIYLTSADFYGDGVRKKKQSIFMYDLDLVIEVTNTDTKDKTLPLVVYNNRLDEGLDIPEDIRKIFTENLERNLSYSHISSFQKCPYQFYFKYVLQIPGSESQARSFGMTIHNTLKEFYERVRSVKQGFSNISRLPKYQDLIGIYKNKWQSDGYEGIQQEKDRFESGKLALKNFYDRFYDKNQDPILLEHRFRVPMGKYWLKGTIDRVDKTENGLEIIDYKTGRIPSDEKHIEKDLQLPTYVLALERLQKEKIEKVSLLYVEEGQKISTEISQKSKDKSIKEITNCLEEIKKAKYLPKPGPLCRFCDYKNVCNYANMD